MSCLSTYEPRYTAFLTAMKVDIDEYLQTGRVSGAQRLADATGEPLRADRLPQHFTGDLDADFVLVHLNPKEGDQPEWHRHMKTFEEVFDVFRHFGQRMYGPEDSTYQSNFDDKQVRFLKPFNVINLVDERGGADGKKDRRQNLERAIDDKLQLEMVPYASNNFNTSAFSRELLQEHFDRLLAVITAKPRGYVIFCGSVFEPLLKSFITEDFEFTVPKNDGNETRDSARFSTLVLPGAVKAGLAQTWPRQGLPMASYARAIIDRY